MPNSFDSIPSALTQRALANNFSLEEKARRDAALLNRAFYYGNQEGELNLVNNDVECKIINLTKPIVKKRSTLLYRNKLNREFVGPAASVSFLETVYEENDIDNLLLQTDLLAELTGSCLVHPQQVETIGNFTTGIKLRLFDGSSISVVPEDDDQSMPAAISLIKLIDRLAEISTPDNPQVERIIRQQIWTKTGVTTFDGTRMINTETNELDFLPFVNFHGEEVYDQYIGHAPTTIVRKLNHDINQTMTDLGYMIKMQAATPIALTGYSSGEALVLNPGSAFNLPMNGTATPLQLNPKIEEVLEVIKFLEEKIFETSSVPKVTVIGGEQASSGVELLIRWYPIVQIFQEKVVRYEKKELELANMILHVAGLEPLDEIHVDYPAADLLPLNTSDEALERDIKLNLRTPIDEMMKLNPELSEIEAEAEVLANKTFNDNLFNNGTDSEEEEDQEENNGTESEEDEDQEELDDGTTSNSRSDSGSDS